MTYQFIYENPDTHSVETMARVLHVTRSGYYAWLQRGPSSRKQADQQLVEQIREIQQQEKLRLGSPRLTDRLAKRGRRVGHNRVARLIAEHDLGARRKKPFRLTTQSTAASG